MTDFVGPYRRIVLPPQERPPGYRQDYGPRSGGSRDSIAGGRPGRIDTPKVPGFRVVERTPDGVRLRVVYENEEGHRFTVYHLRSSREGNG